MLKPKDIGDKRVPSSAPLIKFGDGDERGRGTLIAVLVSVFIVAALYVCGIMLKNSVFTMLAFIVGVIAVILFVWSHRHNRADRVKMTEKEIDAAVERYKQDLVDTYIGYDLEYTVDDVLDAADAYRETLEVETASVMDVDPGTLVKMIGESFRNTSGAGDDDEEDSDAISAEEESGR